LQKYNLDSERLVEHDMTLHCTFVSFSTAHQAVFQSSVKSTISWSMPHSAVDIFQHGCYLNTSCPPSALGGKITSCSCFTIHSDWPFYIQTPSLVLLHLTMTYPQFSIEVVTSIIFGLLQLLIGLISVWQLRNMRQTNGAR
jgi:hypothetical protein